MPLNGYAVVAQSGGPTAVINSSVAGVIHEAAEHPEIESVYGALNGVLGILNEDLFDLSQESKADIDGLLVTPAAALGSCRYKLKDLEKSKADYDRVMEVFKAHNIRYFFYCGGNDSMDTADKIRQLSEDMGYEMRIMGIAKTVDNDLGFTDHCPGYGSVIKYNATAIMESGKDTEALYTTDTATVMEVMGRNAGWIAAGCALAHREEEDAPHLIYLPEITFSIPRFVEDCKKVLERFGRISIVAGEGIKDADGNYVAEQKGDFATDSFGHVQLGGLAEVLKAIVEKEVGVKCRYVKLSTCQRSAMHFASLTDRDEAYACGREAVLQAAAGTTGFMVGLKRVSDDPYRSEPSLAGLRDVANAEKKVPREWINREGNFPTEDFIHYARPLVEGEVKVPIAGGVPRYTRLKRNLIEKKCPERSAG